MLVSILINVLMYAATIVISSILVTPVIMIALLAIEGVLGEVLRDYFGPPRPQIRVIGPGGPDDVLFEGEEVGVKSTLRQIPYAEKRGWRIEKMEPLPPKLLNILR